MPDLPAPRPSALAQGAGPPPPPKTKLGFAASDPGQAAKGGPEPLDLPAPMGRAEAPEQVADRAAKPARGPSLVGIEPLAGAGDLELEDVPAPKTGAVFGGDREPARESASFGDLELDDLPAPKTGAVLGSDEALTGASAGTGRLELDDLPAPKTGAVLGSDGASPGESVGSGDLELEGLPAPKTGAVLGADRASAGESGGSGNLKLDDLPAPKTGAVFGTDGASAPESGDLEFGDLPAPKAGAAVGADDAPVQQPAVSGELEFGDLPAPKTGPAVDADAPVSLDRASLGDLEVPDLPVSKAEPAPDAATGRPSESFEELNLGLDEISEPTAATKVGFPAAVPLGQDPNGGGAQGPPELPPLPEAGEVASGSAEGLGEVDDFGELELPLPEASPTPAAPRQPTAQGLGPVGDPGAEPPASQPSWDSPGPAPRVGAAVPPPTPGAAGAGPRVGGAPGAWDGPELPPSRLSEEGGDDMFAVSPPDSAGGGLPSGPLPKPVQRETGIGEELDLEPEPAELEQPVQDAAGRVGVGGTSFGEVDLGIGEAFDELEFGVAGAESQLDVERPVSLPPDILRRQTRAEFKARQQALGKKAVRAVIGVGVILAVIALVGMSLGLTEHGFFGMYFIEQYLPSAGNPVFATEAIQDAEKTASTDTYADVRASLSVLGRARKTAGLNRRLLTRSLLHESLFLVRFGQHSESSARAAAILAQLEERSRKAPGMDLALAADALRRGALDQVASHLRAARSQSPSDPYVALLAGELALRQNQTEQAQQAFARALELGGGARAQWGLARVPLKGDDEARLAAIEGTLKLSPQHAEARIARARILFARGKEPQALQALREATGMVAVDGKYAWVSKPTKAAGFSLLGYLHETRGRLPLARKAYQNALAADPYRVEALLGAGRVSLREHRHGDALAHFESALKTSETNDPLVISGRRASVEAELGVGRAFILLGRTQEAKARLQALAAKFPEDGDVVLSLGDAYKGLGEREQAEQQYRKAIELRPNEFGGYLALAQFFFALDRAEDASKILNQAAANVPESAEMRRLLGQSEMARNRLDEAIDEFKRALELDPEDLAARFGLGVALRKSGKLHAAKNAFEQVARRDPAYGGLAMQKGLLYEAKGEYAQAEESYRSALKEDPDDTDLLLRLGAAQVASDDMQAASETLQKVIKELPNSAEAEHLIGRIALARGRTPDALMHFDRSVALDGTRAEFHLYAGKAALEMSNLGRTLQEAQTAIELDPSMGDAYWLRGMVRLRMGAVKDALQDFEHSLQLKPSQYAAYAAIGDCYDQMRKLSAAVRFYKKALEKEPDNGRWWYRLGRLELDAGNRDGAARAFVRATQLGDAQQEAPQKEAPRWLADAHRLSGEAQRRRRDRRAAIVHFKRYLELAPPSGIDRREVMQTLRRWGVEVE